MYSMLIVDDEKWVRQGLKQTIDWQSHGIEIWGEAENGEEAFTWLSRTAPDIVITDIKMPGMDGLSLLEHINENKLHSKVIIISGYGEFAYAQKALKCGASGYVLKPIEEQMLLEVVQRCVNELQRESAVEEMKWQIRQSMPLAQQRYLEQFLLGESDQSFQDADAIWSALRLQLNPRELQVAAIRIHDWGSKGETRNDRKNLLYGLRNIAEQSLSDNGYKSVFCKLGDSRDADVAVVFSPELEKSGNPEEVIPSVLQQALEMSKRLLDLTASAGVSRICSWKDLSRAYNDAIYACSYSFIEGHGKLYNCFRLPPQRIELGVPYAAPGTEWENRLIHALKIGDGNLLEQSINGLQERVESLLQKYDPLQVTRSLNMLLTNIFFKLKSCVNDEEAAEQSILKEIRCHSLHMDDLSGQLLNHMQTWSARIRGTASYSKIIELGLEYIGKHFFGQITLQDVSNHLFVNASYFSKLFHEEVGETFVRYVAGLRILKAKQLLNDTNMKIYEIADEVGYNDFRHFVKTFKDIVGLTPSQYRDSV
ncbi:response regulator [Paenibacillus alkalitolerans]|uniref:response regulator n=1 Tax=Paenibacillus alkalitolerans TaxID=2799335 RepID=UPI0018F51119|nr:response regulator [Paenibacillus alkalitolerans]